MIALVKLARDLSIAIPCITWPVYQGVKISAETQQCEIVIDQLESLANCSIIRDSITVKLKIYIPQSAITWLESKERMPQEIFLLNGTVA